MQAILYFDGVCHLCNKAIDFFIRNDKKKIFYYAPLQGENAREKLDPVLRNSLSTVVFVYDNVIYTQSDAILKALSLLGLPYSFFSYFKFLPKFFRDWIYLMISKNRYKVFGKNDVCRIPNKAEREMFLD